MKVRDFIRELSLLDNEDAHVLIYDYNLDNGFDYANACILKPHPSYATNFILIGTGKPFYTQNKQQCTPAMAAI